VIIESPRSSSSLHAQPVIDVLRTTLSATTPARGTAGGRLHVHRYVWSGDDPFSSSSLYRCRCGVVRPAL